MVTAHAIAQQLVGVNIVYSRAERAFNLEYDFTSKSSAAVREAFISAYPDKAVQNKTTGNETSGRGSVCYRKHIRRRTVLTGATLHNVDITTAHTANTTALLQGFFSERIVGRGLWPPRSPDLTARDCFLRGFIKERVYSNNPQSLEELKHNTEQTVASN
jgi:hypothetical protein